MADDDALAGAFERLRMAHQPFRRASEDEVRELEVLRLEAAKLGTAEDAVLAEVQLRVMERAFDILQLGRFANAPENHGWMNLFRQWANAAPLDRLYSSMRERCSPMFRGFFEHYVQGRVLSIDRDPVPHAWLRAADQPPGVFMDSGRTEPPVPHGSRPGAAGIVDAKGSNEADQAYETPSGTADQKPSAPNE